MDADVGVAGGGLAGVVAGGAAARGGCRTVLSQDRPAPGGRARGEWPVGARGAASGGTPRGRHARAALGLAIHLLLGLSASFCFKECGTDADRTWFYFVVGNVLGPLSVIFLMLAYSSMNPNLASALVMGLGSVATQIAFGWVYDVTLSSLQWTGISMVVTGAVIAVAGGAGRSRTEPMKKRKA